MPHVDVKLPHHHYRIEIGHGCLAKLGPTAHRVAPHGRAAVFVDAAVMESYGAAVQHALEGSKYDVLRRAVPSGEQHKNLDTVRLLYDVLLDAHLERRSPVLAVGGGVIGDTVGFVAATYLRGVPFIQVPTTLLAMVDSSVGGKVGVNVPQGKNLIGAFHQPQLVVIDTDTLATLPPRELRCGLAECVKHAIIRDPALFDWIEKHVDKILALDGKTMVELVHWNVSIKAIVVMADEKEAGERAHLNFGHTFGHAIEATTGYGVILHGEAVALGMVAAMNLAADLRRIPRDRVTRVVTLLSRIGLPTKSSALLDTPALMQAMYTDKKVASGKLRLILPVKEAGVVQIVNDVPTAAIEHAWETIRG